MSRFAVGVLEVNAVTSLTSATVTVPPVGAAVPPPVVVQPVMSIAATAATETGATMRWNFNFPPVQDGCESACFLGTPIGIFTENPMAGLLHSQNCRGKSYLLVTINRFILRFWNFFAPFALNSHRFGVAPKFQFQNVRMFEA